MKKRLLSLLVALCMLAALLPINAISVFADSGGENSSIGKTSSDHVYWQYDDPTATLTIYGSGQMQDFPDTADIPWWNDSSEIKKIIVQDGVTSIGESAFMYCRSLTDVTLPDGTTSIGAWAFAGCNALTGIVLPESLSTIGERAFSGCTSLTSLIIPGNVSYVGNKAFRGCISLESVVLSEGVTTIGDSAFFACSNLTNITFPVSVVSIRSDAFWDCTSIKNITYAGTKEQFDQLKKDIVTGTATWGAMNLTFQNALSVIFDYGADIADAQKTKIVRAAKNETISKPADPPKRSGYTLAGYYTDPAFQTEFNFNTPITESITLYAKWIVSEEPSPEAGTYTLKVVGGSFTVNDSAAQTVGIVPVDAEATVVLNPDAVPEGMVFDQWTISEGRLLGNPNVAYNARTLTIPANTVDKGTTVIVEAQYRDASIEDDGPDLLGTAAMIGTVGISAAVLGYQGYMLGTELYLKYALPSGAAIPANAAELAVLVWNDAGQPAPAAVLEADAASEQKALTWAVENQLLPADKAADASVGRAEVIRVWNQAQKMK